MDNLFNQIISLENLFASWEEFKKGKRKKLDVSEFEKNLEDEIFRLHRDLKSKAYRHSDYTSFYITDPKLRHIHKAIVRDRIVHHAIYRILYPIFDKGFIFDTYSCRNDKGSHKAIYRFEHFARKVSKNYSDTCFVLKCDVRRFFDSIDHEILKRLIRKKVDDKDTMWLIENIIDSFGENRGKPNTNQASFDFLKPKGTPIGNLTSQLFANVYLDELDQYVKHILKVKYYIRYCDDFVILSRDKEYLSRVKEEVREFLGTILKLTLHKDKVTIRKLGQGVDFLGYITVPHFRVLRAKTKRRVINRVTEKNLPSYLGVLKHCNGHRLENVIKAKVNKQVSDNDRSAS